MSKGDPDLGALRDIVSDKVIRAMDVAHQTLSAAGIPHALAGALAVGAYGYPRASKDVDFLVGPEAFDHHESGIVSLKPGVPIEYMGIPIDTISPPIGAEFLSEAIGRAKTSGGIPVLPVEALVCMKLMSPRRKDAADIVELVEAGLDVESVLTYLRQNAPPLVGKLEELAEGA